MTLDLGCITKLDCGCEAYEVLGISASYIEIKLCPMHTAAQEMLDALKLVAHARPTMYVRGDGTDTPFLISNFVLDKVKQAIAKGELPK